MRARHGCLVAGGALRSRGGRGLLGLGLLGLGLLDVVEVRGPEAASGRASVSNKRVDTRKHAREVVAEELHAAERTKNRVSAISTAIHVTKRTHMSVESL